MKDPQPIPTELDVLSPTRRHFLTHVAPGGALGLGALALGDLFGPSALAAPQPKSPNTQHPTPNAFPAKVKRVIYLFQSGAPAAQELFDYKPLLNEKQGEQLPDHIRGQQRLTGMSANQASLPLAGSAFKFAQHGKGGTW